ncbi:glycosyltransferase family 25 protein [Vibrio coralliilyticus]|uniref:glycosyltransferase family 25 protein n=1 Tax=Vibrio coralliilyticus TaxID=190893 RepID=UPI001E5B5D1E|nr:glycosyltransferase family 25 protein [Vibrio coralliilyticus]MCC2524579.1 glycosyltransferase family 25 protein [Vibrio coralliilyticus]
MKVFVISLQRSPERREYIKKQLDQLNIDFEFFDAVDGRAEPPHKLFENYNYAKRLWLTSGRMPSKGELGCYGSHYLLWQMCVELNTPLLIIEDDSEVQSIIQDLYHVIEREVLKYGFLRLEPKTNKCTLYLKEKNDGYSIHFMSNNFGGTRAYAIAPMAAKKLLAHSGRWCMPVDNYIGSIYLHNMPSYLLTPCIVENPEEFGTTIQLGEETKAKWYRKPTRELYSLYRKLILRIYNRKYQ